MMRYLFKKKGGVYYFGDEVVSKECFFEIKSLINSLKSPRKFDSFKAEDKVKLTSSVLEYLVYDYLYVFKEIDLFKDLCKLNATVTYINRNYDSSVKFTVLADNITSMSCVYDFNKTLDRFVTVNRMSDIFGGGFDDDDFIADSPLISRFSEYSLLKDGLDYFFSVNIDGLTADKRLGEYNGEQLSSVSYNRFTRNLSVHLTTVFEDFKLKEIGSRDYKKSDVVVSNGVLIVKLSPRH